MAIKNDLSLIFCSLLLFFFVNNHLTYGADTISANRSLSGDQTIISTGGNFILGFFQPSKSSNYYIGIWYSKVSVQTVVWVANREIPVSDKNSAELRILDGNLVLVNESKTPIWSSNITSTSSNDVVAVLRDDGNFVLTDVSNLNTTTPFWQSFDNPGNTFLPGAKISYSYNKRTNRKQLLTSWKNSENPEPGLFTLELDPNGGQYIIRWNRSEQYWTSGHWNGRIFSLVPEMRLNYIFNFSYIDNENETYFTYSLYSPASIISRLIMDVSGQIKQLTWLESSKEWNLFWSQPRQQCEVYAYCGAFGTCNQNSLPFCNCLDGFKSKSDENWSLNDYSGGCVRERSLRPCGNSSSTSNGENDIFFMKSDMILPMHSQSVTAASGADCESACLRNCSCTAYTYDNDSCSIWYGELLNLQQLSSGYSGGRPIYIRLAASEISSGKSNNGGNSSARTIIIVTTVFSVILVLSFVTCILCRWRNRGRGGQTSRDDEYILKDVIAQGASSDVPSFSLQSIEAATDKFSATNKLGQGGFGPVYKGRLSDGREIAVKKLSKSSGQGAKEFKNEVLLISKLQHRSLVQLLGFCIKGEEKMLVYEYMPNKSLDKLIFGSTENGVPNWSLRYKIIEGIARGLLYLHHDSRLKIIHRDLKTSNILLDEHMNPKISDFGMARIFRGDQSTANTNRVVGTYGYMSPEYAMQGIFSKKSDVFSFGVLLLEVISGKRNNGFHHYENPQNLLDYAWQLWKEGKPLELLDPRLDNLYNPAQVNKCIHVALLCVQGHATDRPTMSMVVSMLCNKMSLPSPDRPAFSLSERVDESNMSLPKSFTCSRNDISITSVHGR